MLILFWFFAYLSKLRPSRLVAVADTRNQGVKEK